MPLASLILHLIAYSGKASTFTCPLFDLVQLAPQCVFLRFCSHGPQSRAGPAQCIIKQNVPCAAKECILFNKMCHALPLKTLTFLQLLTRSNERQSWQLIFEQE